MVIGDKKIINNGRDAVEETIVLRTGALYIDVSW